MPNANALAWLQKSQQSFATSLVFPHHSLSPSSPQFQSNLAIVSVLPHHSFSPTQLQLSPYSPQFQPFLSIVPFLCPLYRKSLFSAPQAYLLQISIQICQTNLIKNFNFHLFFSPTCSQLSSFQSYLLTAVLFSALPAHSCPLFSPTCSQLSYFQSYLQTTVLF